MSTEISNPEQEMMLCDVLLEFPQPVLPLPCDVSIIVMSLRLITRYWYDCRCQAAARVSECSAKVKSGHFGRRVIQ